MSIIARCAPSSRLLTPENHTLMLIDFQPQMAFSTQSIDGVRLRNNAAIVARTAAGFDVPTILTTVKSRSFSGPMFEEVTDAFPMQALIDRSTMNCWEDGKVIRAVNDIARTRMVMTGLWTSVCIAAPVLSALEQGYEVCVIADACGDVTPEAHELAVTRMVQAGAQPMTSLQYLLELQRDWDRHETADLTSDIVRHLAGSYGVGMNYMNAMLWAAEE